MSLYSSCPCGIPDGSDEEHLRTDCPQYGRGRSRRKTVPNPNSDLIEAMARAIARSEGHIAASVSLPVLQVGVFWRWAKAALTAAEPLIRRQAFEEAAGKTFQARVREWTLTCFGPTIADDRLERRDRLVEETLELAQTLPAFTADRAHALVDYVFSRPVGVTEQEVGGVSVTLAALCSAEGIDQSHWAETELARISAPEVVEKIRAKQASKPVGSALPIATHAQQGGQSDGQ